MSVKNGTWIRFNETASEFISRGIPEIGDTVIIEYDQRYTTPSFGVAKRFASLSETTENIAYSPEYGVDYIFTGDIA